MSRARDLADSADLNFDSNTLAIDTVNNRVGIGTASPAYPLELESSSGAGTQFGVTYAPNSVTLLLRSGGGDVNVGSVGAHPLLFKTSNTEQMRLDTSGNLKFNSGYGSVATAYGCRAWVNFDGTGTLSIRGSGNVSSVTDAGTGSYHVIFTNAMPDANYAAPTAVGGSNGVYDLSSKSTTQCNFFTRDLSGNQQDQSTVDFAVFR